MEMILPQYCAITLAYRTVIPTARGRAIIAQDGDQVVQLTAAKKIPSHHVAEKINSEKLFAEWFWGTESRWQSVRRPLLGFNRLFRGGLPDNECQNDFKKFFLPRFWAVVPTNRLVFFTRLNTPFFKNFLRNVNVFNDCLRRRFPDRKISTKKSFSESIFSIAPIEIGWQDAGRGDFALQLEWWLR